MTAQDPLASVRNNLIKFATMRPPGSTFAVLGRRVRILEPRELVQIAESGNLQHVAGLIELLKDPARSWAAEVMLASMTGLEQDIVDANQADPDGWLRSLGQTAHERWARWFSGVRDRLVWNTEERIFIEEPKP